MNRFLVASAAALALMLPATNSPAEETHTSDSLETVKKNIASGKAVLVDVREEEEWQAGHLKGARLVPLSGLINGKEKEVAQGLKKDVILYTHCARGKRALLAAEELRQLGFEVRALKQGYAELVESGFEKAGK